MFWQQEVYGNGALRCMDYFSVADELCRCQPVQEAWDAKIGNFDNSHKLIGSTEVLHMAPGAVVLDVWVAAGPQYLVVGLTHFPVEVGHAKLVIFYTTLQSKRSKGVHYTASNTR